MPLHSESKQTRENVQKIAKCIIPLAAVIISDPLWTQNAIPASLRRALIFLIILQENNTLLDKKLKRLFLQKKSFIFPIENGQQQIYLFLFEYSRRPSWFLFRHTPTGDQSPKPPSPLPTHLNINWRLTYQCQYVFLSRADIRMQSSLLWAAEKRQKGEGGQSTWYDTTCFSLCRIFNSPQSLLLSGPFDNICTDQSSLSL